MWSKAHLLSAAPVREDRQVLVERGLVEGQQRAAEPTGDEITPLGAELLKGEAPGI